MKVQKKDKSQTEPSGAVEVRFLKKSHTRTVKLKFLSDFFQKLFNQLKGKLSATDVKRLIVINIPYFFIFVIANRISCLYQISPGMTVSDKMMYLMTHSDKVLGLVPSTDIIDILIGAGTAVATKLLCGRSSRTPRSSEKVWNMALPDGETGMILNHICQTIPG